MFVCLCKFRCHLLRGADSVSSVCSGLLHLPGAPRGEQREGYVHSMIPTPLSVAFLVGFLRTRDWSRSRGG